MRLPPNEMRISGLPESIAASLIELIKPRKMVGAKKPDGKLWITILGGRTRDHVMYEVQTLIADLYRQHLAQAEAESYLRHEENLEAAVA